MLQAKQLRWKGYQKSAKSYKYIQQWGILHCLQQRFRLKNASLLPFFVLKCFKLNLSFFGTNLIEKLKVNISNIIIVVVYLIILNHSKMQNFVKSISYVACYYLLYWVLAITWATHRSKKSFKPSLSGV